MNKITNNVSRGLQTKKRFPIKEFMDCGLIKKSAKFIVIALMLLCTSKVNAQCDTAEMCTITINLYSPWGFDLETDFNIVEVYQNSTLIGGIPLMGQNFQSHQFQVCPNSMIHIEWLFLEDLDDLGYTFVILDNNTTDTLFSNIQLTDLDISNSGNAYLDIIPPCNASQSCPVVSEIQVTADLTTATITWNSTASNNFAYVLDTFNAPRIYNSGATQTLDTSLTLTNLLPNTQYRFYLQNVCNETTNDTSMWNYVDFGTYYTAYPVQNTGINYVDYAITLPDSTILYFYNDYRNYLSFMGASTNDSTIVVPRRANLQNGTVATISRVGYDCCSLDFSNAPNVKSLTLPSTITYITARFPSSIKELHLNSYPNFESYFDIGLSYLDIVYVPAELLEQFYSDADWHRKVLILAEGTQPFATTINMSRAGEFAYLVLSATNNDWNKINELTVTGPLSTNDLNNFKLLKMLTKLDLSQAEITDIPSNFSGVIFDECGFTLLEELNLPELNIIGNNAFINAYRLKKVVMPGVIGINELAFENSYKLDSLVLPEGLQSIGNYVFSNSGIRYANFPTSLITIGRSAFENTNLVNANLPNGIKYIPSECFRYCDSLKSVTIPESVKNIGESAFSNTALDSIDLSGVETIGSSAFANCTNLSKVNFSDSLRNIYSGAFSGCIALTEVDLPANLYNVISGSFSNCTNVTKFTCRTIIPPYTGTWDFDYIMNNCDLTNVEFYVPAISIPDYRVSGAWQSFYRMLPLEDKITYLSVTKEMIIDSAYTIDTNAVVDVNWLYNNYHGDRYYEYIFTKGILNFRGEDTLKMKSYTQHHQQGYKDDYGRYENSVIYTSLIANGEMDADSVTTTLEGVSNQRWYFISFPYDVRASEIGYTPGCQFVIRKYSGLNRAQQTGNTWQNITIDSVLHAYEGYILKCSMNGASFTFPSMDGGAIKLFEKDDVIMPVHEYISEFDHNRSWNFIGNPYPCYYDTRRMEFTAPITVWNRNNNRYDAYSPVDDSYILEPLEAFFVQAPVDQEAITFNKEGRQTNDTVYEIELDESNINYSMKLQDRKLFNLLISDGKDTDRTRIVLNESASCGYELDKDATKLIDAGSEAMLIYTLVDTLKYAINERPLDDETVSLGFYAPHKGEYTISLDTKENEHVLLIDHEKCIQADLTMGFYSFSAEKGYTDKRFSVLFGKDGNVGIEDVENTNIQFKVNRNQLTVTADYTVYSIDGKHIATAKADETVTLKTGVYLVVSKNVTRKIVIAL